MSIKAITTTLLLSTLTLAAPTSNSPRQNGLPPTTPVLATLLPVLSQYNTGTSTVTYNTNTGLVQRTPGSGNDITTLMTFTLPQQYTSNTCERVFTLTNAGANVSGTGRAQVFFDSQPARAGATSNFRDTQVGTLQAVQGAYGTFGTSDGQVQGQLIRFPCSQLLSNPDYELAPAGDAVSIRWYAGDGFKINVLA